ncbi:MAG: alpha/beta hydrolase [Desulfobacteraceae bacterium]|nr:MAG: alpha/beta hydrolase [Desulfobacteraceae bacterium]
MPNPENLFKPLSEGCFKKMIYSGMKMLCMSLAFIFCSTPAISAEEKPVSETGPEVVILLHGMARTERSMRPLEAHLAENGFSVINTGYPSTEETVETIAEQHLAAMVEQCRKKNALKIHIVTHSLGGIVTRQYLQNHALPEGSRIVMISPPNKGSELADAFHKLFIYDWLNGPAGQVLGTGPESLPNTLKPVKGEIGVITGDASFNPLYSWLIPGPDDGKVSVESAKLHEMKDFLVVTSSHSFIMRNNKVLKQVVYFLRNGKFDHESESGRL